jgi:hypothetical protein
MTGTQLKTTVGETMRWAGTWAVGSAATVLTGYTLVAEVRRTLTRELALEVPCTIGDQLTAPGTYTVNVSGLAAGEYELRIRYTEPDGDVYRSTPISLLVEAP